MSITDELREWASVEVPYKYGHQLTAIADRIDAEHKKACDDAWDNGYEADYLGIEKWLTEHPQAMEHHGWIRLPKDADGEYVHIDDVMEWPDGKTFEVVGIGEGTLFYVEDGSECADWTGASTKRHHHAPTVEDVLREFAEKITDSQIPNVHPTYEEAITEYAKRLKLAEGVDA